jgi:hypothetical protein
MIKVRTVRSARDYETFEMFWTKRSAWRKAKNHVREHGAYAAALIEVDGLKVLVCDASMEPKVTT